MTSQLNRLVVGAVLALPGLAAGLQPVLACVAEAVRPPTKESDAAPRPPAVPPSSREGGNSPENEPAKQETCISFRADPGEMIHRPARLLGVFQFLPLAVARPADRFNILGRPIGLIESPPFASTPVVEFGRSAHWPCGPPRHPIVAANVTTSVVHV